MAEVKLLTLELSVPLPAEHSSSGAPPPSLRGRCGGSESGV